MQMGKTVDQSKAVCKDSEGNPITDTFSSYILANQECPSCGKAMKLQKSRNGKFFMACTNYPLCNKTMLVDVDLIEKYICRNGGAGQLCPRCNRSLEAKAGPYGVYIQCCGIMQHKYKMDEI
jgi:ssDNA-binding Zn-finger/Zn-ribbon topoisomerase 1